MTPEFFDELRKDGGECTLPCFLSFLRKNAIHSPGNQQDRMQLFLTKALFWWFLDLECFDPGRHEASKQATILLLESGLTELLLFQKSLSSFPVSDTETRTWLRSVLLSLLGKLSGHLERLRRPSCERPYEMGKEIQSVLDGSLEASKQYIQLMNVKQPFREVPEFSSLDYQRSFFQKFNNVFCQICSITDTLSDADYFIFCEVP